MIWRGKLEWRDVEGGTWMLLGAGGHVLIGTIPRELDGATVEVEGEELEAFGIAMAGPQIAVRTIRKA